jgi:hypothetical protein
MINGRREAMEAREAREGVRKRSGSEPRSTEYGAREYGAHPRFPPLLPLQGYDFGVEMTTKWAEMAVRPLRSEVPVLPPYIVRGYLTFLVLRSEYGYLHNIRPRYLQAYLSRSPGFERRGYTEYGVRSTNRRIAAVTPPVTWQGCNPDLPFPSSVPWSYPFVSGSLLTGPERA